MFRKDGKYEEGVNKLLKNESKTIQAEYFYYFCASKDHGKYCTLYGTQNMSIYFDTIHSSI